MGQPRLARRWLFGSLIVVALSGAVAAAAWHQVAKSTAAKPSAAQQADAPPLVKVFHVATAGYQAPGTQLTGSVRARYETNIAFRVAGKVLTRKIEVGDRVRSGQLLFELDPIDYQLQLKTAEANLEVARAAVAQSVAEEKRLLELRRTNAVSASEYERGLSERDIAVGRRESAQKQLELAQNQLAYCQLKADSDGIVTAISGEAGQVVTLGETICTIAQREPLEAVVDIPENRLPHDVHLETTVSFWSLPGVVCRAQLRELSPNADPLTRTFRGRFTLLNPPDAVQLGMTATVVLNAAGSRDDLEIPASSIIKFSGKPAVWLVMDDGSVKAQPITIKQFGTERVIVSQGLLGGQRIVAAAVYKLDASSKVRAWEVHQ